MGRGFRVLRVFGGLGASGFRVFLNFRVLGFLGFRILWFRAAWFGGLKSTSHQGTWRLKYIVLRYPELFNPRV